MIKIIYRNNVIDTFVSKIEAEVKYENMDDITISEFCDICETNKPEPNQTICSDCTQGINVDLFA